MNFLLTPKDIDLFYCDPHDFVKHQNFPLVNFYNPRVTAVTLFNELVKHHSKDVNQGLIGYLTDILSLYACSAWFCSPNNLSKKKSVKDLEGIMVTSIYPNFNSQVAFLKFRVCLMVHRFSEILMVGR